MTVSLIDLWLPILTSAVVVFIASFIAHVILPHHKSDWKKLPNEEQIMGVIRTGNVPAGQYMFIHCHDMKELNDPEMKKRFEEGPLGTLNVWVGVPSMPRNLVLTFVVYLLISLFIAYLASLGVRGSGFVEVFRFTGTAAVMAYTLGWLCNSIWFRQPPRAFFNDLADSIVYSLLTGFVFAWLWPAADMSVVGV